MLTWRISGRVGVLACALLLHRNVVKTSLEAILFYFRHRTRLESLENGGLEACVATFKGPDGGEETLVTGVASLWMTPSMQRYIFHIHFHISCYFFMLHINLVLVGLFWNVFFP
jgi:hypothetical protein